MKYDGIIAHYGEASLKGHNRPEFLRRLHANIKDVLADLPGLRVQRFSGRFWIYPSSKHELADEAMQRLHYVGGLTHFSRAKRCDLDMEAMQKTALLLVQPLSYQTFCVRSRRVFKEMPYGSELTDRTVGGYLAEHKPAKVKLKGADLEVKIEMMPNGAFVYAEKISSFGGLPMDSGGKVAALLSGGIDSPVAAHRMQKRGCRVVFVHFHSQPFLDGAAQEKAMQLAQVLTRYQGSALVYSIPFGELQNEIVANAPAKLRVVLYRRFMMRIAERVMHKEKARALVTGECLGQVASQTLMNLAAIDAAANVPVLRPLISFDKRDIITEARALGTYDISVLPDQDCCQLFVPKSPETYARLDDVVAAEQALDIEALCNDALRRAELKVLRAPWLPEVKKAAPLLVSA